MINSYSHTYNDFLHSNPTLSEVIMDGEVGSKIAFLQVRIEDFRSCKME